MSGLRRFGFILGILVFLCGSLTAWAESYHPDIHSYVKYLQRPSTYPTDYIMELFERFDLVILCERSHMDITQYQLLTELAQDERFIEQVGHIFTEVGTTSIRGKVREFLTSKTLSKAEAEQRLLDIYRNLTWFAIWEKTNFYDFLRQLQAFNATLPEDRMVQVYPSDLPFSWEGMTAAAYQEFRKTLVNRDQIMAREVETKFREIQESSPRKKALVIMNYRHAFNDFPLYKDQKMDNTGRYLFERFPGKVANVLINTVALHPGTTDQEAITKPIQDGKWDAAFEVMGNIECGFDLTGTPFGKDSFDLWPFTEHQATYQDVFTGLIFFQPLSRHKQVVGIPGIVDAAYRPVLAHRLEISGHKSPHAQSPTFGDYLNHLREFPYDNLQEMTKMIAVWLQPSR